MLGIILRVIAFILFLVAAVGQTIFEQPPLDLAYFGLAAWVLATLIGGYDFGGRIGRDT